MRSALFIDNGAVHDAIRTLGQDREADYAAIAKHLPETEVAFQHFFTAMVVDKDGIAPMRKLVDWIEYNGFRMACIDVPADQEGGLRRARPAIVGHMTVAMIEAADAGIDHLWIYSGDESLVPAVKAVQRKGARVSVVMMRESCSDALRRAADHFSSLIDYPLVRTRGARTVVA